MVVRPRVACFAALLLASAPAAAQSNDDLAIDRRMTAYGFTPLAEMAFGGRDVRRILPLDPTLIMATPGIELERHRDGRRTMRVQYIGWVGASYTLTPAEWQPLEQLEAAAFADTRTAGEKRSIDVTNHCWSGLLAASPDRLASWNGCNERTRAAQAYTEAVLATAMTKRACPPSNRELYWRYLFCFREDTLDDPALDARFAEVRARWTKQREPGADILQAARAALREAGSDLAKPREAVFAFGRHLGALREILWSSERGFPRRDATSLRNAMILNATRRSWSEDIDAQTRNYVGLLEDLAKLQAEPGAPPR